MELTQQQKAAIETTADKVVVVSGAGCTKTTVITERIKHLLSQGVMSSDIYAITYTNMAAGEMASRIGNEGGHMFIGTIHRLANQILLQNGIDTSGVISEENFDGLLELIKTSNITIPTIPYLLVDEFQDIQDVQYSFIFDDLRPEHYFVVGDCCQAIYGFDVDSPGNYRLLQEMYEDKSNTTYELTRNYRSYHDIITFAKGFLASMHDIYQPSIFCDRRGKGDIEEMSFNLNTISDEIRNSTDRYGDWFILCRKRDQIAAISEHLNKEGIPWITFKQSELTNESLKATMEENTVKLLTVHSSKGLERKNVIVVGTHTGDAEERRVSYVAATRAKDRLIWMGISPTKKGRHYFPRNIKPKKVKDESMLEW